MSGANTKKSLNLAEIYKSVQGETSFTGLPTTFVRLAKCNLRCHWCDTPHSFGKGKPVALQDITAKAEEFGCKHICITGGEPLLQENVYPLMDQFCELGFIVSLETGGSISTQRVNSRIHTILDIKCPGSGMSDKNHWENLNRLRDHDEVKFVVKDENDYNYSLDICKKYALFSRQKQVLLSPVHGLLDPKELINWILRDKIPARLNLQIHKLIWPPKMLGV
ncbi:MAG: 7-carboxy-7-deazaguanine synthase [Chlamydiae bacterium]|nr:7-carboxy-7-deazaguanine synthase [Chlamydiota bacterium]